MTRPKLLFVVNADWFFVSHRLALGKACREAGFEVHVAAGASEARAVIEEAGFTFHPIPIDRGGTHPARDFATLSALFSLYKKLRPDVVHHVTIKPNLYGGLAARALGIPSVHAVSGLGFVFIAPDKRSLGHQALQRTLKAAYRLVFAREKSRIIFQNPTDRREFILQKMAEERRTCLLPGSGVDLERFSEVPLPEGAPVVLLPARLLWDKGVGEFVKAARDLKGEFPEARFVLAGRVDPGNPRAIEERVVQGWVEEGVVEWWGEIENARMPDAYAKAGLVVLPSYREGLPLCLAEAQARGRACVTTDVPGCRDAVVAGKTAWLVPVREVEPLTEALREALRDPDELTMRSKAAAEFARHTFAQEVIFQGTLRLYEELGVTPG